MKIARDFACDNDWLMTEPEKKNASVWHDLRKNRNDLLADNVEVAVEIGYQSVFGEWNIEKDFARLINGQWDFLHAQYKETQVIAWCEIPKFEEN